MQWTFGIDTSSTAIYLALINSRGEEITRERHVVNSHAEHIFPLAQELFNEVAIKAQDITNAGVVVGPGSFTGLRIGISFVKGLFITQETPITPLSSFEVIAQAAPLTHGTIGVALDARQDNLFWASFTKNKNSLTPLDSPMRITKEEFYQQKITTCETIYFDTMGFSNSSLFNDLAPSSQAISLQDSKLPRALGAAQLAGIYKNDTQTSALDIEPNYMQVSYAERTQGSKK